MKTLYEDERWLIQMNTSGEVFVTNKEVRDPFKPTIRIGSSRDGWGMSVTADSCHLTPWALNDLPAFLVSRK